MYLVFFGPERDSMTAAEHQYAGTIAALDANSILAVLEKHVQEDWLYRWGWVSVCEVHPDTATVHWYGGTVRLAQRRMPDTDTLVVALSDLKFNQPLPQEITTMTVTESKTGNEFAANAILRLQRIGTALPALQQALMGYYKVGIELQKLLADNQPMMNDVMSIQTDVTYLEQQMHGLAGMLAQRSAAETSSPTHSHGDGHSHSHDHGHLPHAHARLQPRTVPTPEQAPVPAAAAEDVPSFVLSPDQPEVKSDRVSAALQKMQTASEQASKLIHDAKLDLAEAQAGHVVPPTEESSEAPVAVVDREHLLTALAGPRSIFTHYLSPEVMQGGRGFAKPGYAGLKAYRDDLTKVPPGHLVEWFSGFYRNEATNDRQLLLKFPGILVLLDKLQDPNAIGLVAIHNKQNGRWNPITSLDNSSITALMVLIRDYFHHLENVDKAGQSI